MDRTVLAQRIAIGIGSVVVFAGFMSHIAHYGGRFFVGPKWYVVADARGGSAGIAINVYAPLETGVFFEHRKYEMSLPSLLGYYEFRITRRAPSLEIDIPMLWIFSAILPLLAGVYTQWRLRLWMLLAYTALVAVQCAWYARGPW